MEIFTKYSVNSVNFNADGNKNHKGAAAGNHLRRNDSYSMY
jgi:hypothetical protein